MTEMTMEFALRAALSKVMLELDAMKIIHDLEPYQGRRVFAPHELEIGASTGLVAKMDGHYLEVWSDS